MEITPATDEQIHSLQLLYESIGEHRPSSDPDSWSCPLSGDGSFLVEAIRLKLDNTEPATNEVIIPWIHEIPIKVNSFIWRANMGRIPSYIALKRRGVGIPNASCPQCQLEEEDAEHILIRCPVASNVWEPIFKWCNIPKPQFQTIGELIEFVKTWGRCRKRRNNLICIIFGAMWILWKTRCEGVFKVKRTSHFQIIDSVKSVVFTWIRHRRVNCCLS